LENGPYVAYYYCVGVELKSSCRGLASIVFFGVGCNDTAQGLLGFGDDKTPPQPPLEAQHSVDKSSEGERNARSDFQAGIVQVIEFGELPPKGYVDQKSGLPLGSMGCEESDEEVPYRDAYNRTMKTLVAENAPFPPDLSIMYKVDQKDQHDVILVTAEEVLVNGKPHATILEDRLKVGLLARNHPNVPARIAKGSTRWSLTVTDNNGQWIGSWGEEGSFMSANLLVVLEEWREGR
jgi:hypothetical protein